MYDYVYYWYSLIQINRLFFVDKARALTEAMTRQRHPLPESLEYALS